MKKFVIVSENKPELCDEHILSSHLHAIDEPYKIYFPVDNQLKEVTFGKIQKINQDQDSPLIYAIQELLVDNTVICQISLYDE